MRRRQGGSSFLRTGSMRALAVLIGKSPVRCIKKESDRYGRLLAQCFSDNTDLGAEQVRQGWAVAYRKYTRTYVAIEERAREARKGMWAGAFEMPWNWRRKNR
ncbi:MAG: thermonuclease family protein [Rhodospirillaceae bacterium]|nr:thermonuclease family protein [Rhodospirillaceae bacterium]